MRDRWIPSVVLVVLLGGTGCGVGGTIHAQQRGAALAREAMRCPTLDTAFGTPARYMASKDFLYRGCGQYTLVRCTTSQTPSTDEGSVCQVVETVPEAVALQDR